MTFGMTRLDALFHTPEAYRLGVADYRVDGRPDYAYQASVLYSDTVTPTRLSLFMVQRNVPGKSIANILRVDRRRCRFARTEDGIPS